MFSIQYARNHKLVVDEKISMEFIEAFADSCYMRKPTISLNFVTKMFGIPFYNTQKSIINGFKELNDFNFVNPTYVLSDLLLTADCFFALAEKVNSDKSREALEQYALLKIIYEDMHKPKIRPTYTDMLVAMAAEQVDDERERSLILGKIE